MIAIIKILLALICTSSLGVIWFVATEYIRHKKEDAYEESSTMERFLMGVVVFILIVFCLTIAGGSIVGILSALEYKGWISI